MPGYVSDMEGGRGDEGGGVHDCEDGGDEH